MLNVVISNVVDLSGDLLFVEEPVVIMNLECCIFVLHVFEDHFNVSPLGFSILEFFAYFNSGMWIICHDHFGKEPDQFIKSFDGFSFFMLNE